VGCLVAVCKPESKQKTTIPWISKTRSQGCIDLHGLVKCLDAMSDAVCTQALLC